VILVKYKLLISDIAEPIVGIRSFHLSLPVVRLETTRYVLNNEHQSTYVKVLGLAEVDDTHAVSDADLHIFDVDLPDDMWIPKVEELARRWLQLEACSTDLTTLKRKVEIASVSMLPWTLSRSLRDLSRVWAALAEIRGMIREIGTEAAWQSYVSNIVNLADSVKEKLEGKYAIVQARKTYLDHILWIVTTSLAIFEILRRLLPWILTIGATNSTMIRELFP
jgi:hypothetical protein